ncbi:MAG TPA: carbohydrate ABC transporter permease [Ruminiclostridium sp.]
MLKRRSVSEITFDYFNIIFLVFSVVIMIYPFLYVVFASLSDPARFAEHSGLLLSPLSLSFDSYKAVFDNPNILNGYKNTLVYLLVGTTINMALTTLGAYSLSLRKLKMRNYIMMGIVFTMLFNGGLIPTYILIKNLHFIDSIWAITLPSAISTMNLIIMRTSFQSIPASLEESARIDGANDLVIFARIMIPLSIPVISVMILFYGVGNWNAWFNASIYLRSREKYPLQLILREILIQNSTDSMMTGAAASDDKSLVSETIKYATIVVATVPILMVYPMLQKYFVKGVMVGAIKG